VNICLLKTLPDSARDDFARELYEVASVAGDVDLYK